MHCPHCWVRKFWLQSTQNSCGKRPDPLPPLDEENAVDLEQISGTRPLLGRTNEPKTAFLGHFYRALRHAYISNSKTLKSVSVSASVTLINSEPIKVCICNPESHQITDIVTDYRNSLQTGVTDIPTGLLGFGWGSGNNYELHV